MKLYILLKLTQLIGFLPVFVFTFYIWLFWQLNIIQYDFWTGAWRKIYWGTIKTILTDCFCLGTIGLIVAPWKFDILKSRLSIFAIKASLLRQIFVLRTSNFCRQLSANSFSTETPCKDVYNKNVNELKLETLYDHLWCTFFSSV